MTRSAAFVLLGLLALTFRGCDALHLPSIIKSGLAADTPTHEADISHREGRSGILASFNYDQTGDAVPNQRDDATVCGIRRNSVPDIFTRIVGGSEAENHEFPWQVSLQWQFSVYNYHVCGASVLSSRWVVTAAHCTHQFKPENMLVVAGINDIKMKEGSAQKRTVDRIAEHWGYNPNTQENDIALLRVSMPFMIDGLTVAPVCLPPPNHRFQDNCVVSGWGKTSENGQSAHRLRKVVVPIITRQQCTESYRVIGYGGPISDKMLCAGYNQGVKDACQGDSGGPFVCRGRDNRFLLAGVVSWGVGCARPNIPGVYTEVSRYIGWISSIVHGRAEGETQRAAALQTSMHLNHIFNISTDGGDESAEQTEVPAGPHFQFTPPTNANQRDIDLSEISAQDLAPPEYPSSSPDYAGPEELEDVVSPGADPTAAVAAGWNPAALGLDSIFQWSDPDEGGNPGNGTDSDAAQEDVPGNHDYESPLPEGDYVLYDNNTSDGTQDSA